MNSYKASDFIAAIPDTGGIVSAIARKVGCDWHTAKKYIDAYPTVKAAYDAECERVLDVAETVIIEDIVKQHDTQTAKWYLTMKGHERGYAPTQRNEITGRDGEPLIDNELSRQRDTALVALAAAINTKLSGTDTE